MYICINGFDWVKKCGYLLFVKNSDVFLYLLYCIESVIFEDLIKVKLDRLWESIVF